MDAMVDERLSSIMVSFALAAAPEVMVNWQREIVCPKEFGLLWKGHLGSA
jgi:hypothetical protein